MGTTITDPSQGDPPWSLMWNWSAYNNINSSIEHKKPYFLGYGFSIGGQWPKTPLNQTHGPKNQNPAPDRPSGPDPVGALARKPPGFGGGPLQQWPLSLHFQVPGDPIGMDSLFHGGPALYGPRPLGTSLPVQKPKDHPQETPILCKGCPCGLLPGLFCLSPALGNELLPTAQHLEIRNIKGIQAIGPGGINRVSGPDDQRPPKGNHRGQPIPSELALYQGRNL